MESFSSFFEQYNDSIALKDKEEIISKIKSFSAAEKEHVFVLSDFDGTITTCGSTHSILHRSDLVGERATKEIDGFCDYYLQLEVSPKISEAEREVFMIEWWTKTQDKLVTQQIPKKELPRVVREAHIVLRKGFKELSFFLEKNGIPLVIFSGGITDLIEEILLQQLGRRLSNVIIVANTPVWNEHGILESWLPDPPFHTLSKTGEGLLSYLQSQNSCDEIAIKETLFSRKHVILLGDMNGDSKMTEGFGFENIIKCCFIRRPFEPESEIAQVTRKLFDILVLNDGPMDIVCQIINLVTK